MEDCLFCNIAGDSSKLIWENETVAAFNDIHPKAPVHVLVVPKKHYTRLDDLDDVSLAGELILAIRQVAKEQGVEGAYRVVTNNGAAVGQVVGHLHFHLLGRKVREDHANLDEQI